MTAPSTVRADQAIGAESRTRYAAVRSRTVRHGIGQPEVAGMVGRLGFSGEFWDLARIASRLNPVRHGGIQCERVVRRGSQQRVVAVAPSWQHHLEVAVHVLYPAYPLGGGRAACKYCG
jgi:hypothetical protein